MIWPSLTWISLGATFCSLYSAENVLAFHKPPRGDQKPMKWTQERAFGQEVCNELLKPKVFIFSYVRAVM